MGIQFHSDECSSLAPIWIGGWHRPVLLEVYIPDDSAEGAEPGFPQPLWIQHCSPGGSGTDTLGETEIQAEGQQCPQGQWDGYILDFLTGLPPGREDDEFQGLKRRDWGQSLEGEQFWCAGD